MQSYWLHLFGKFKLLAPNGAPIALGTQKNEALLAMLAVRRRSGVNREELAKSLWPRSPHEKRQANLRQALAILRKALGPQYVEASRTHCRLSDSLRLQTDMDDLSLRSSSEFLPGFEGDWVEEIRHSFRAEMGPAQREATPVGNFLGLLEWMGEHNPERMLGLMRENLQMTNGLRRLDCRRLLAFVKGPTRLEGWKQFFEASDLMSSGSVVVAGRLFRRAIDWAECENDVSLGVLAAVQLRICADFQNLTHRSREATALCGAIASGSSSSPFFAKVLENKGLMLASAGEVDPAFKLMQRSEQLNDDEFDAACTRALRAFHLASRGLIFEADSLETELSKLASTSGHLFIKTLCALTRALISFHAGEPVDAIPEIRHALSVAETYENYHMVVPAQELLAEALLCNGQEADARVHVLLSKKLRRTLSMEYMPSDRIRLSGLRRRWKRGRTAVA